MLIAVGADKGSPGVTTAALALASAWSERALVVEADPAGGDLAIRLHPNGSALPEAPTVLTVAATAARSSSDPELLPRYAHRVNENVSVVPGAVLREQMAKIGDWEPLADAVAGSGVPVFADLGHLHACSPALGVAARADLVVTLARPEPTSVIRLRERLIRLATDLGALRGSPPRLFALLVSSTRHGEGHVSDLLSIVAETTARPFVAGAGCLAHDPAAVRRLEAGEDPAGRLARTDLLRTAGAVAARLAACIGTGSTSAANGPVRTGGGRL